MVTKPKRRTPRERIAKSATVIRNIPRDMVSAERRNKGGSVQKEWFLTRCVSHIRTISRYAPEDIRIPPKTDLERSAVKALREAYKTYEFLQNFDPMVGESLHSKPGTKEFSLDAMGSDDESKTLLEDGIVETSAPDLYSGGLGYRHVNWDAEYLMAQPKGKHINPYWRPDLPRNQPGTKEHREMLSLEESGYWACQPREPNKWYEKMGWTLVESSSR